MHTSALNKNRNLVKTTADKFCHYIKHFKKLFNNIKGQASVLEYAVLIVVIILALVAMQAYLKRSFQGKMRDSADQIGSQYDPEDTQSDFTVRSMSHISTISTLTINETDNTTNATTVSTTNYDIQQRTGYETVGAYKKNHAHEE